jgi:hypothetical protein
MPKLQFLLPLLAMVAFAPTKWTLYADEPTDSNAGDPYDGSAYLGKWSIEQGEGIDLYVHSTHGFVVELSQVGVENYPHWTSDLQPARIQAIPAERPWETALNWTDPLLIPVDSYAPSGYYQLDISFEDGTSESLFFVVREDEPGSVSGMLVLDNATSRAAYNNWGGKSVYGFNSTDGKAQIVNLYRPGSYTLPKDMANFIKWAERADVELEWASSLDWHNNPDLFADYDTIVLVEHSEYWTFEMREQLDRHLARGGNLLSMSGNTAWWQIRIEGDKLVSYKYANDDPLYGVNNSLVTTNFCADPVNDPENRTIGVSWRGGGYHNASGYYMAQDGYGGYEIERPEHYLFAGTGLTKGDVIGREHTIVGYEVDGAAFERIDGMPVVTGIDGTPTTLEIVATAPAATNQWSGTGTAVAGYVGEQGGQIINMSTVDWADGLWDPWRNQVADPLVGKITLNAINQLSPNAGAACETDACHASPYNDADADGVDDKCDNCIVQVGEQFDSDGDGTGNFCDLSPYHAAGAECGAPTFDPAVEGGVYIWLNCLAEGPEEFWSVRVVGGDRLWSIHEGELSSADGPIRVRAYNVDTNDTFDTVGNDEVVDFRFLNATGALDGFNAWIGQTQEACLDVSLLQDDMRMYLGAQKLPVEAPFDLKTFGICRQYDADAP